MAVPGSVVGVGKLITPGGQQGPKGDAGTAANVPLADITQNGLLRQTPGLTTSFLDGTNNYQPIAPVITSVRLRSYNAVGNPNFEVDQVNVGNALLNASNVRVIDRWFLAKNGTMQVTTQQVASTVSIPGTLFPITAKVLAITLTTQQTTLGAGDYLSLTQYIEGPSFRELSTDQHSCSILIYSTVANLKLSLGFRDPSSTKSLLKVCTIPNASTWTLIPFSNLPVWPSATFSIAPGSVGYILSLGLAIGSTNTAPANDTFQNGNFTGAVGADNWASKPVNSIIYIAMIQHEPGSVCSTLMDKPFMQNYDECLRYYQKTYDYATAVGTATAIGCMDAVVSATTSNWAICNRGFLKPMAKIPTVTIYDSNNGAVNSLFNNSLATHIAVSSFNGISDKSLGAIALNIQATAGQWLSGHYTADTGW